MIEFARLKQLVLLGVLISGIISEGGSLITGQAVAIQRGTILSPGSKTEEIMKDMKRVEDRQLQNPAGNLCTGMSSTSDWNQGVLFMGLSAMAKLSCDSDYIEALNDMVESYHFRRESLDFMDKEWLATIEQFYDEEEHLIYGDSFCFDKGESSGKKIFRSRGNGWILAGLARVLEDMPLDDPSRFRYEKRFVSMAETIAALQPEEGLWHPSPLDPNSKPYLEAISTGLFCYAMASGVNQGLLIKRKFLHVIEKAWGGLTRCVENNGKLGCAQLSGEGSTVVSADMITDYGVGAFLLAGSSARDVYYGWIPAKQQSGWYPGASLGKCACSLCQCSCLCLFREESIC